MKNRIRIKCFNLLAALFMVLLSVGIISPMSVSANESDNISAYTEQYMVRKGDSLSQISKALRNNVNDWKVIYDANSDQIKDWNLIYPGQVFIVPVSDENSFVNNNSDIASGWSEEDWKSLGMLTLKERKKYLGYIRLEPEVSSVMKKAADISNGKLEGFENRCKTPSSLYNKLYLRPEKTRIENVGDIVRYTEILPEESYTSGTKETLDAFIQAGFDVAKLRNAWIDTERPYQGINVEIASKEGFKVELQFHTQKSFDAKNSKESHAVYEELRLLSPDDPKYKELQEKNKSFYKDVIVPDGVETILEDEYVELAKAS